MIELARMKRSAETQANLQLERPIARPVTRLTGKTLLARKIRAQNGADIAHTPQNANR